MALRAVLVFVVTFNVSFASTVEEDINKAREDAHAYVESHDGCAFADGYVCIPPAEDDFLGAASQQRMISGNLMKAWLAALEKFEGEPWHTEESRNLKHYKVGLTESDEHYIVLFQGLLLPRVKDGEFAGYLTETLGTTTRYWIDKTTFEVNTRLYYK